MSLLTRLGLRVPVPGVGQVEAAGTPDGALFVADWKQSLILRGMGYLATIGAFSTGIAGGGAGTILDLDQPEGLVSVPEGVAIVPLSIGIQAETPLLAADDDEAELLIAVDRTASWNEDGTFTTESPTNLRTDIRAGSRCLVRSAFSADMTRRPAAGGTADDPVLDMELARRIIVADSQTAAGVLWGHLDLHYEPRYAPVLVGPCALYLYWGGTVAVNGYAQLAWAEADAAFFNHLVAR